ncbi:WecB/TagA/CpsF family glycosyltransferase [Vibrio sp. DNB22_10_4]
MSKILCEKVIDAPCIYQRFEQHLTHDRPEAVSTELVSFVNPYSYMVLKKHKEAHTQVDHYYSDALVSSALLSLLGRKKVPRISFDYGSFAKHFLKATSEAATPVYFIGAKPQEIEGTVASFREAYPKLNIVGYRHGYFDSESDKLAVIDSIIASGAEFVVCGMGTPYQESFGALLKSRTSKIKQVYTCGGFLHQSANHVQYYPDWVNKLQLRALYRIINEQHVLKRVLVQYPQFVFCVFYDYFRG